MPALVPLPIPIREQLVEVDCGGQTRLSLLTLVLPSQERLLEFIFPVLLRWLLRAALLRYATLRLA
jgi:hypothetical protein